MDFDARIANLVCNWGDAGNMTYNAILTFDVIRPVDNGFAIDVFIGQGPERQRVNNFSVLVVPVGNHTVWFPINFTELHDNHMTMEFSVNNQMFGRLDWDWNVNANIWQLPPNIVPVFTEFQINWLARDGMDAFQEQRDDFNGIDGPRMGRRGVVVDLEEGRRESTPEEDVDDFSEEEIED
ncbi:unnamed protein product [Caenorhabditis nigoni]